MSSIQRHRRHHHLPSTSRRHDFSFFTTSTLFLLTTFSILLSLLITPSFALPATLEPRRNPLTLGLGLGGGRGGVGLSLGGNGNTLFNFHHRPRRNLHIRSTTEPEAEEVLAAEKNEAVVASFLKRSTLSGPPASGAEADSDTANNNRPLGSPRQGQYHILPIDPSETTPMESSPGEEGGVVRRMVNKKRQHVPGPRPGTGGDYNKNNPYGRRSEE